MYSDANFAPPFVTKNDASFNRVHVNFLNGSRVSTNGTTGSGGSGATGATGESGATVAIKYLIGNEQTILVGGPQFITNSVDGVDILSSSLKVGSTFELFVSGRFFGSSTTQITMFLTFMNSLPTQSETDATLCEINMNGFSNSSQDHDFTINSVFRILELTSNVSIRILWSIESSVMAEITTDTVTKNISNRTGRLIDTPDRSGEGSTLTPRLGFASNENLPFIMQNFYIRRIV